jgi:hypothetical protein
LLHPMPISPARSRSDLPPSAKVEGGRAVSLAAS